MWTGGKGKWRAYTGGEQVRSEIDPSLKRPVHEISQRGNVYYMRRNEEVGVIVAAEYMAPQ